MGGFGQLGGLAIIIWLLAIIVWIIMIIVFFVMASNLGTTVKLLRAILKELKDANDPMVMKAKAYDSTKS